jgi:biotin carboxylase
MVVAGSNWQIPILRKITQMGYKSLVVNLYENSPAFQYADYYEIADILDKKRCLEIAQEYKINGVISEQCDIAMSTVAFIAEELNLPSLGTSCAALYTNKSEMRYFCSKNKLPSIEYRVCKTEIEAQDFFKSLKSKMIIKPLDSNSSRGVYTISDETNLHIFFSDSLFCSRVDQAIIAERYIEGPEFTVDGIKIGDNHCTLAISKKKHYEHNTNIAYELFFSHFDDVYNYENLKIVNDKFVTLSGLPDGCLTHAEYKYQDGKFYLIEIAARGGGNLISSDIVPIMSGFDSYSYLINASLGNVNDVKTVEISDLLKNRCAVLFFFDADVDSGVVNEIKGLPILEESPNVLTYKLNFKVGDYITRAKNDSERIGFYIAYADSKQELIDLQKIINANFKIKYYEKGNN